MNPKPISDLALAAFLSTIGHKFKSLKPCGKKVIFIFDHSEQLERDILAFYNRSARVDPLTFAEIFRNLKAIALGN